MKTTKITYPLHVDPSFPPLTVEGVGLPNYPGLAVHKNNDIYVVDHIASGFWIASFSHRRTALWFVEQVWDLLDWTGDLEAVLTVINARHDIGNYLTNLDFYGDSPENPVNKPEPLITRPVRLSMF